jgi:hypothetical protein
MCSIFVFSLIAYAAEKKTVKANKCYELISGKANEMCRLYEQNLNRFCNEPPMVCDRKIHPDFAQYFSFPKWEEVDVEKNLHIIEAYIKFEAPENARCAKKDEQCQVDWREEKWRKYKYDLFEQMKKGNVILSRARFNARRFGDEEQIVYRLVDGPCTLGPEFWNSPRIPDLIVFDEKTGNLNRDYTTILGSSPHEVFFYKGETQLSIWDGCAGCSVDKIIIGYPNDMKCEIKYIGKKGSKAK